LQLCETESYTGQKFDRAEVEKLMEGRFAFVNCWRPIRDEPVKVKPLALCDTYSVDPETFLKYELRFPERTGENYSLEPSKEHSWYYFPDMEKEDCILFYVYDKKKRVHALCSIRLSMIRLLPRMHPIENRLKLGPLFATRSRRREASSSIWFIRITRPGSDCG
jgi:hypothetical protein